MNRWILSRNLMRTLWTTTLLAMSLLAMSPKAVSASSGYIPSPMHSFGGMPFYGGQYCAPQMGQMQGMVGGCGVNPMALAYSLNWSGAQPMGASYLTPIGLSALGNHFNHNNMMWSAAAR
ncbi:MAG: hypothetical protein IT285_00175 [Bdellovibrionales bacterium]|nr:hypothetical protein [Bdellovibrionales bacterium]